MCNRERLTHEAAERRKELDAILLVLLLVKLHEAVRVNLNAEVPQRTISHQLKGLRHQRLVGIGHLLGRGVIDDRLRLELAAHHLRLQPDQLTGEQRDLLLHRAQPQAGILALDLLRRCGLGRRGLTTDDVGNARDLVDLPLDVLPGLIALN